MTWYQCTTAGIQTGTLTENRMTVVEGWFAGRHYQDKVPDVNDLPEAVKEHLELNIAMNSKVPLCCNTGCHITPAGTASTKNKLRALQGMSTAVVPAHLYCTC